MIKNLAGMKHYRLNQKSEGVFHKDLETGKAASCSCECWSNGNKPCFGMRSVGWLMDPKLVLQIMKLEKSLKFHQKGDVP